MKLIAQIQVGIKKGFLPHFANEIYKRGCILHHLTQVENRDDVDVFDIQISYAAHENLRSFIEKINAHAENFSLLKAHNVLEENIVGGLLQITPKIPFDNSRDYQTNVLGATELILDRIKLDQRPFDFLGINRNIAQISGLKSGTDLKRHVPEWYVKNERDAIIISTFGGLNAFPLVITYDHIEDFIRSIKAVENNFSAIRVNFFDGIESIAQLRQIYDEITLPFILRAYDEIPLYVMSALIAIAKKSRIDMADTNVGFIGIDPGVLRLTRLLALAPCQRVLGYDSNEKLMMEFEKEGGLATTPENIFSNADMVLLFKDHFTIDDFYKIRPGLVLFSLIDDHSLDVDAIAERGIKAFIHGDWIDTALLYPGLIKGCLQTGRKNFTDQDLLALSYKLGSLLSFSGRQVDIFSAIHDTIADLVQKLS